MQARKPLRVYSGPSPNANASTLSDIIANAGSDFGQTEQDLFSITPEHNPLQVNQHVYAKAFAQFIHQLQPSNQSALLQAFADDIDAAMAQHQTEQNARLDNAGPFAELAYAAGLQDSFVRAFEEVKIITPCNMSDLHMRCSYKSFLSKGYDVMHFCSLISYAQP